MAEWWLIHAEWWLLPTSVGRTQLYNIITTSNIHICTTSMRAFYRGYLVGVGIFYTMFGSVVFSENRAVAIMYTYVRTCSMSFDSA